MSERWKVVIVGGGFGGLCSPALELKSGGRDAYRSAELSPLQPPLYSNRHSIKSQRARFRRERSRRRGLDGIKQIRPTRRSSAEVLSGTSAISQYRDHAADVVVTSAMPCNSATDEKSGMRPDQTLPFEPFSLCELLRFPRSVSCDFYFLINRLGLRLH